MNIHYIQHVPFEGIGTMENFYQMSHHQVNATRLYAGEVLPDIHEIDLLIVMGGPMSVHDEAHYPWLKTEKKFIEQYLKRNKKLLGICLGAQIIAQVLGAQIKSNGLNEIGWFRFNPSRELQNTRLQSVFSKPCEVFHWHSETFDIPVGAIPIGSSAACANQGYIMDELIIGLQFHIEMTELIAKELIENCSEQMVATTYVQSKKQILENTAAYNDLMQINRCLLQSLDG